jgi:hypothetical protein
VKEKVQAEEPRREEPDRLLRIAGLVNGYHNDGTKLSAAETLAAIADVLGDPFDFSSSAVVVGADQQEKEQEDHARVDVGAQLDRPSASTGSTAPGNKAAPPRCIVDGVCDDDPRCLECKNETEIHIALGRAFTDIVEALRYWAPEHRAAVLECAAVALGPAPADDAVDPHLSARGTDAGPRAQESSSSPALPDPGSPEREK